MPPTEIIGIVGDTRWNIAEAPLPMLYWPIYGNDYSVATIVVRSDRDVESLAMPVQKIIGSLDADLPVSDVITLNQALGKSTIDSAFDSMLVSRFRSNRTGARRGRPLWSPRLSRHAAHLRDRDPHRARRKA